MKTTDLRKPAGLTLVGVFALLFSIMSGFHAFASIPRNLGSEFLRMDAALVAFNFWWFIVFFGVIALSGLLVFKLLLSNESSKYLWYGLMTYWVSLIAFSFIRDFTSLSIVSHFYPLVFLIYNLPTYVYPAICTAYFLTKKPRQCFHLSSELSASDAET